MKEKVLVLTDFDGTITKQDVGDLLIRKYGPLDWQKYEKEYIDRKLSSRDTLSYYYKNLSIGINQIYEFIDNNVEMDEEFINFYLLCKERTYDIYILSDGMDFYISYILKKYGIDDLKFFSNKLINSNEVGIKFPYYNKECGMCGNCKSSHLERLADKDTLVIYIGDGNSDRCISKKVDVLFAKDDLHNYCKENNINHIEIDGFFDVIKSINEIIRRISDANNIN